MNRLGFRSLLLVLVLAGCGGKAAPTETVTNKDKRVLKIAVFPDGRVTVDGVPASIKEIHESLRNLSEGHGVVWYYREAAQQDPPPIAMEIMREIVAVRVPIRISTKPDYSDSVGP